MTRRAVVIGLTIISAVVVSMVAAFDRTDPMVFTIVDHETKAPIPNAFARLEGYTTNAGWEGLIARFVHDIQRQDYCVFQVSDSQGEIVLSGEKAASTSVRADFWAPRHGWAYRKIRDGLTSGGTYSGEVIIETRAAGPVVDLYRVDQIRVKWANSLEYADQSIIVCVTSQDPDGIKSEEYHKFVDALRAEVEDIKNSGGPAVRLLGHPR